MVFLKHRSRLKKITATCQTSRVKLSLMVTWTSLSLSGGFQRGSTVFSYLIQLASLKYSSWSTLSSLMCVCVGGGGLLSVAVFFVCVCACASRLLLPSCCPWQDVLSLCPPACSLCFVSINPPSPAPVHMQSLIARVCALPPTILLVCVSSFACLTRVPSPYVTSSLTGPHDRDRGAGHWPRVGLTLPDPQMPAGLCVYVCELGHRCPYHVAPCSLPQLGPLITDCFTPSFHPFLSHSLFEAFMVPLTQRSIVIDRSGSWCSVVAVEECEEREPESERFTVHCGA